MRCLVNQPYYHAETFTAVRSTFYFLSQRRLSRINKVARKKCSRFYHLLTGRGNITIKKRLFLHVMEKRSPRQSINYSLLLQANLSR